MDLERARPLVQPKRTPSPTPIRRGGSPLPSRSRSPRHSISIRSPSYTRRSPEGGHPDDLPPDDLLQGDPHQDTTDVLGPLPAPRIAAMPRMTAMLTVHSHGASGKLLSPAD